VLGASISIKIKTDAIVVFAALLGMPVTASLALYGSCTDYPRLMYGIFGRLK